jgi:hypothetical protein
VDLSTQSVEERRVCHIAERLTPWIYADGEIGADGGQQGRGLFDRQACDEAALDPTVLRSRYADRLGDNRPAEISIDSTGTEFAKHSGSEFTTPTRADIDRSLAARHGAQHGESGLPEPYFAVTAASPTARG